MMVRTQTVFGSVAIAALVLFTGCGGGSSNTGSPSGGGTGGGGTPNPSTTITITTSGGVSPKTLTVARGTQVTFVNNDNRPHDMESNPHPEHTDCPELMQVGFLAAGQSKQSGNLNIARTCGYHDHEDPTNTNWQGSIITK